MKALKFFPIFALLAVLISPEVPANHVAYNVSARPAGYKGTRLYSIKYDYIQVRIDNNIAHTEVEQVLRNETRSPLETQIFFPFPDGAAITKYSMWMGDKRMNGELLEKDKARKIYQDIVRKKKDPALLQFVGNAAFRSSVYPIPARGEKKLRFTYDETLHYDSGVYKYEYVLATGRFSEQPFEKLVIEVQVHSEKAIKSVYSPTHDIQMKRIDENNVEVRYEEKNARPDMNFELYYSVSDEDVGLSLMTYKEKGEEGYFMVMASPKLDFKDDEVVGKNVVFVFDHSGSMAGEKIHQARGALEFCLNSLNEKDMFSLITFSTSVDSEQKEVVPATRENVNNALDSVRKMGAGGGTDINAALMLALKHAGDNDAEIIFLTDGMPTIGPKSDGIMKNVAKAAGDKIRLFIFGVGHNVNTHFLDRISIDHNGFAIYVRPDENIEVKVSSFFAKISYPVFREVDLDFDGVTVYDVFPKKIDSIFRGQQILVFGRYKSAGEAAIRLTGKTGAGERKFAYKATFPDERLENEFIPKIWASRKIGYLSEQIRLNGTDKELVDEIVQLSRKYGIITEYTSFLVDADRNMSRAEMNEATEYNFSSANVIQKGSWAISQRVNESRWQYNGRIFDNKNNDRSGKLVDMNGRTRQIGNRAFYYRNGQWIDSTLENYKPDREIVKFSKEYFKFSDDNKAYNGFMSLGGDVIVNFNGKAVRIR